MPTFLLAATLLSLILHSWYATTTPLALTLVAMGLYMAWGVWKWWRAPRRFGRG